MAWRNWTQTPVLSQGYNRRQRQVIGVRRQGSLLEWKGRYGWIAPDFPIDHPQASMHGHRVFVSITDLSNVPQEALVKGARLSFLAYSDGDGVGAQEALLEDEDWEIQDAGEEKGLGGCSSPGAGWRVQKSIVKKPLLSGGKKGKGKSQALSVSPPQPKGAAKAVAKNGKGAGGLGTNGGPKPIRTKETHTGQCGMLSWASSEMQGWRPAMEDAVCAEASMPSPLESFAMFGVFDGHGGAKVSAKAAEGLPGEIVACAQQAATIGVIDVVHFALEQALPSFDAKLREDGDGVAGFLPSMGGKPIQSDVKNAFGLMGSTAVVAMLECEGSPSEGRPLRVVVANIGDSRAALCRAGQAVALSEDHKPEDAGERARIEAAGGFVASVGPCNRIDGWGLNLSRALGDFHYKARDDLPAGEQKVSCVPDLCSEEITEQDEFLFLGCDGVFELHSTQSAIDLARGALLEGKPLAQVVEELVDACCSSDLQRTCGHGGDNVSVMIIQLRPDLVT